MSEQESGQVSEEEIEKALDEIFKEDTQTIRERVKSLIKSYDNALNELVENDKKINELQKENTKLKEENITLEGNKIGYKLAIQELGKGNGEKETIKIVKKGENAYDVWGIPGTSSYENYKEAATKVSKYIEKLQKENKNAEERNHSLGLDFIQIGEKLGLENFGTQNILLGIEKLQKENQQLKDDQLWSEATIEWLKERFIPKEKIDAKIKELKEEESKIKNKGTLLIDEEKKTISHYGVEGMNDVINLVAIRKEIGFLEKISNKELLGE